MLALATVVSFNPDVIERALGRYFNVISTYKMPGGDWAANGAGSPRSKLRNPRP